MSNIMDIDEETAAPRVEATVGAKVDGRSRTSAVNSANAGIAKGTQLANKRTYNPDALAEHLAAKLLAGANLPVNKAGPPSDEDRRNTVRITGETVEAFQSRFLSKLIEIGDKAADRIVEKLDEGGQKLSDLNMTLAITVDKMAAISGRTAQSGNVSVTVNNYGAMSREQILASINKGNERNVTPVETESR